MANNTETAPHIVREVLILTAIMTSSKHEVDLLMNTIRERQQANQNGGQVLTLHDILVQPTPGGQYSDLRTQMMEILTTIHLLMEELGPFYAKLLQILGSHTEECRHLASQLYGNSRDTN